MPIGARGGIIPGGMPGGRPGIPGIPGGMPGIIPGGGIGGRGRPPGGGGGIPRGKPCAWAATKHRKIISTATDRGQGGSSYLVVGAA